MKNILNTKRGEYLQTLFLSEKWKSYFKTLSNTVEFNLSIYSEVGNLIFSTESHYPMCRNLQFSQDFRSKCNSYCYSAMMEALNTGNPIIYKCYARIMSFALPVEYMNEKAIIMGQGSFSDYDDFREFTKQLNLLKIEGFPVSSPLRFSDSEHTRNACRVVDNSINQLLKNTQETVILKKRMDSLKEILGTWGVAPKEQPETIYKYMIANLFTLLNIKHIVFFLLDREQSIFKSLYSLKRQNRTAETYSINENDLIVQELLKGKAFISSAEPIMYGRTDFLKDLNAFYFFPVMVNQNLEGILGIFDSELRENDINIIKGFCKQAEMHIENQRLRKELSRKLDGFAAISAITKDITPILNHETLLQTILNKSADLLKAEQGSLMLIDHETEMLLIRAKKTIKNGLTEQLKIQKGEGIAGKVAELGEPILVKDVENDPRVKQKNRLRYKTRSFVSVPIMIGARIIGVLNLSDKATGEVFNEEDLELIQSFATHAAIVMERNVFYNQTEELKRLAITDPLTGLLNRRYLYDRLEEELSRSKRYDRVLSLLMVDIDGFKGYNDTFGHPMGDRALKTITEAIINSVRAMDIVARYGGDEFVIILPETDKPMAVCIAERLRSDVAKTELPPSGITLTISIGIVSYLEDGKTIEILLENVDNALYLAKSNGGNRVEVYS